MLAHKYDNKESAQNDGLVFLPAKTIEYVEKVSPKNGRTYIMGRIQRADVTPGSSFGYNFVIRAFARSIPGDDMVAIGDFGQTIEVYIRDAKNNGGGVGAYYANIMTNGVYERAMASAHKAIIDYPVSE